MSGRNAMPARTIVYSGLGPTMQAFDLDLESGALTLIQSLSFPQVIQYAWPNRARTTLYLATSDAGPMARVKGPNHFIQALDRARRYCAAPTSGAARQSPPAPFARQQRGAPPHRLQRPAGRDGAQDRGRRRHRRGDRAAAASNSA
jgi:hypothetical protein